MDNKHSRRKFLLTGAVAMAGIGASMHSVGYSLPNPKNEKIKVGLIGCGSRGIGLATVIKDLDNITLQACCDVNPDHLNKGLGLAAKSAKGYSDYRKLLEDKQIDAVVIATPLYLHFPMGMDAIDAGKHIYMEKTITHTIPEAIKFSQKLKTSPLVFQVGHQYRYYGLYHKVKEILDNGWCGQVTQFECQYHRNNDWKKAVPDPKLEKSVNWRMYKAYSGGLMTELCAHQIDIVNWFTGNVPTRVTGMGSLDYWKDGREIFDHTRALYHYPNGVTSSVSSILSNAYKGYAIRILGTEGTVEIQRDKAFVYAEPTKVELGVVDGVSGATVKNNTHGEAIPIHFDSPDGRNQEPTLYALADFAKCILERKKPFCDIQEGKNVAIAVHMANQAMEEEKYQFWQDSYNS